MPVNKITDNSGDRKYFAITPLLVWAVCADPYEFTLWGTIKAIIGEQGACELTTDELACLSMMSRGKAHDVRKSLIDKGLLCGEKRTRDDGQPIWNITIPDLWSPNVLWAEDHKSLSAKLEYKKAQKGGVVHHMNGGGCSPHERGVVHHMNGLRGGGCSPHERPLYIKEPYKEPIGLKNHHHQTSSKNDDDAGSGGGVVVRGGGCSILALDLIKALFNGWNNAVAYVLGLDDQRSWALCTWLWAEKLLQAKAPAVEGDPSALLQFLEDKREVEAAYTPLFTGVSNKIGLIRRHVANNYPAPLLDVDVSGLRAAIEKEVLHGEG